MIRITIEAPQEAPRDTISSGLMAMLEQMGHKVRLYHYRKYDVLIGGLLPGGNERPDVIIISKETK